MCRRKDAQIPLDFVQVRKSAQAVLNRILG